MLATAPAERPAIRRMLFLGVLASLQAQGVDSEALLARLGLSVEDLADVPERLDPAVMYDLWTAAVDIGGHGAGLRVAEQVKVDQFDVFGRIVATSATLGDALAKGLRYHRLVSETIRFSLGLTDRRATLGLEALHTRRVHPEAVEFLLGSVVTMGRQLSGTKGPLLEVHVEHTRSENLAQAEAFFGAPIRYGAVANSLVFDSAALLNPVVGFDPERYAELEREAESVLARMDEGGALRRQTVAAISAELNSGGATIERVATRLNLNPRTFRRHLSAEGTTFQKLLDEVRLQLAGTYLNQSSLSVTEIAFRLGYSEKSVFNRAFKRWTGKSPDRVRRD